MAIEFPQYLKMHEQARKYLQEASRGMMRYCSPIEGQPYWTHPMNVHNFLVAQGVVDYETLIASILHDSIENTGATKGCLARTFNQRVAEIVAVVSKPPNYDPEAFYRGIMQFPDDSAMKIKVGDRVDNLLNFYSYSDDALRSDRYIVETGRFFLPMAQAVGWEQPLNAAFQFFKERNAAARSQ